MQSEKKKEVIIISSFAVRYRHISSIYIQKKPVVTFHIAVDYFQCSKTSLSAYASICNYCDQQISAAGKVSIPANGSRKYLQYKRHCSKIQGLKAIACHYDPEIHGFFLLVPSLQADDSYLVDGFHSSHKKCELCLALFSTTQIFVNLTKEEITSREFLCRYNKILKKTKPSQSKPDISVCFTLKQCLKFKNQLIYLFIPGRQQPL